MARGLFITFEGIDGCGKTTQLALLAAQMREQSIDVVETVEPGGTDAGRAVRSILLGNRYANLSARAELFLYFASRAQNVAEVIEPALARGAAVLCDRFTDSTIVYQGAGRGFEPLTIMELHRVACRDLMPDLTFLLDIDLETSLRRARVRNRKTEMRETRMDEQDRAFFDRVREGYHELARREAARVQVINACGSVEEVAGRIWQRIKPYV